jgi:hypothetical protein
MPINFTPRYSITPGIARSLIRIEAAKEKVTLLPVNHTVLASLRETAKLYATHYSTMIEGNQLKPDEIKEVIQLQGHFPAENGTSMKSRVLCRSSSVRAICLTKSSRYRKGYSNPTGSSDE